MKREEIKMKMLLAIEKTKSKSEILAEKMEGVGQELEESYKQFEDKVCGQHSEVQKRLESLATPIRELLTHQKALARVATVSEGQSVSPQRKQQKAGIAGAAKQIYDSIAQLSKNQEIMETYLGDIVKDEESTKQNAAVLRDEFGKLRERYADLLKRSAELVSEVVDFLVDTSAVTAKINKMNSEIKSAEEQRMGLEKVASYLRERLGVWKKHCGILESKLEKVMGYVADTQNAIVVIKRESERVQKASDELDRLGALDRRQELSEKSEKSKKSEKSPPPIAAPAVADTAIKHEKAGEEDEKEAECITTVKKPDAGEEVECKCEPGPIEEQKEKPMEPKVEDSKEPEVEATVPDMKHEEAKHEEGKQEEEKQAEFEPPGEPQEDVTETKVEHTSEPAGEPVSEPVCEPAGEKKKEEGKLDLSTELKNDSSLKEVEGQGENAKAEGKQEDADLIAEGLDL